MTNSKGWWKLRNLAKHINPHNRGGLFLGFGALAAILLAGFLLLPDAVAAKKKKSSANFSGFKEQVAQKSRKRRVKRRRAASRSKTTKRRSYRRSRKSNRRKKTVVRRPRAIDPQHQILADAIQLARSGKFDQAAAKGKQSGLTHAPKLITWLTLQHPSTPKNAADIDAFIKSNPDWPAKQRLRARAEALQFAPSANPQKVVDFFNKRPPITGTGKAALARAYNKLGKTKLARSWIRQAWRNHDLSQGQEKSILTDLSKLLGVEDHLLRADRLTYRRKPKALMRLKQRLKGPEAKLVLAQASLLFYSKRALGRLKAVPKKYRKNLALQYALVRYWRKKNKESKAKPIILAQAVEHSTEAAKKAWWYHRRYFARYFLAEKNPKAAYKMTLAHGFTAGKHFAQAEFLGGWIALTKLNKPGAAVKHFSKLRDGVIWPRSRARAYYWRARAHQVLKQPQLVHKHFELASKYPKTFYGQLARDALGHTRSAPVHVAVPLPNQKARSEISRHELTKITQMLANTGRRDLPVTFLFAMRDAAQDRDQLAAVSNFARKLKYPHLSVRIAKSGEARGLDMGGWAYPHRILPRFAALNAPVDPSLLHGLIRQESEFNPKASSHAGAQGLMQLMPATARGVARQYKQRYQRASLTTDVKYNLRLGSAFLHDLLETFNGSYIMAIASYNAGPGRPIRWNAKFGDPRAGEIDPIDWIESIPFHETRNYVQKVMENLQIYRSHFKPGHTTTLTHDLKRGAATRIVKTGTN